MKSKCVRLIALMTVFAMVLSCFSGCKKKSGNSGSDYLETSDGFFDFDDEAENTDTAETDSTSATSGKSKTKSNSKISATGNSDLSKFNWPELKFKNKKLKWLYWGTPAAGVKDLLKQQYDIDLEVIQCTYDDMEKKFAALVMAGDSPDMVRIKDSSTNFPAYIYKGLCQPVDDYVNFGNKIYKSNMKIYSRFKIDNKNYVLVNAVSEGGAIVYNKRLFREAGISESLYPYQQYKAGKWDWNAFSALCPKLAKDKNGDGAYDQYAFATGSGSAFVYTCGQTFGKLDTANNTVKSNIKSKTIARAVNFLYDLAIDKKYGETSIEGSDDKFKDELIAMNIITDAEHVLNGEWAKSIAKRGDLGIAPMPKDPEASTLYYNTILDMDVIPVGAKNPNAAVAYNACRLYLEQSKVQKNNTINNLKQSYYFTDENVEGYYATENNGTPVFDVCSFVGGQILWITYNSHVPWATCIASEDERIRNNIEAAFGRN